MEEVKEVHLSLPTRDCVTNVSTTKMMRELQRVDQKREVMAAEGGEIAPRTAGVGVGVEVEVRARVVERRDPEAEGGTGATVEKEVVVVIEAGADSGRGDRGIVIGAGGAEVVGGTTGEEAQ